MYWGASDDLQVEAADTASRRRRLGMAVALTLLSIGGSVAMASAQTPHHGPPVVAVASAAYSPLPAPASADRPAPVHMHAPSSDVPPARPQVGAPAGPATAVAPRPATSPTRPPASPAAPEAQAVAGALQTRSVTPAAPALAGADTCAAALAYLGAHSAPGFRFECPGYALGHQAMTCINVSGVCPGAKLIVISVVCPASYMNEAHNSWVLSGLQAGSIDPYGYCH